VALTQRHSKADVISAGDGENGEEKPAKMKASKAAKRKVAAVAKQQSMARRSEGSGRHGHGKRRRSIVSVIESVSGESGGVAA